uniref:Pentraxin (PTX) domain-containing protein n=1 Tax=Electrophorus electricus TaxID=8005 RepID=A0A4W4E8X9_ELEEL
ISDLLSYVFFSLQDAFVENDLLKYYCKYLRLFKVDRQSARLLYSFSRMPTVTVCTRLRFDPNCHGESTVFSYSVPSVKDEFQLRATVTQSEPIQLALLVHGMHGSYQPGFANDAAWHSLCVSWTGKGGEWSISVDGLEVGHGSGLCSTDHIRGNGVFIIGQDQDTFGGSLKNEEAFCGSITQLYIWDRALDTTEIQNMEKECSPIPYGLLFKWSASGLEMEPSLPKHWGHVQCQGKMLVVEVIGGKGALGCGPFNLIEYSKEEKRPVLLTKAW